VERAGAGKKAPVLNGHPGFGPPFGALVGLRGFSEYALGNPAAVKTGLDPPGVPPPEGC